MSPIFKISKIFKAWETYTWHRIKRRVFRMQQRIYKAARYGDLKKVYWLQRKLTCSIDARLLAVYNVTTNRGKDTPDVDQVKSLTAREKVELADKLRLDGKASPIRRVYIPKPGSHDRRPLGIPTIGDRAKQALAKLALEPQHEAYFEPNSYGFRPGRCVHDAIEAIWISLAAARGGNEKYVLDADIAKCFDRIDHQALLEKTRSYPAMKKQIAAWLTAGVMVGLSKAKDHDNRGEPNRSGTPQGGVISPLLANIALHGLEQHIQATVVTGDRTKINLIRYADDFVILHKHRRVIQHCRSAIEVYLRSLGLELNDEKTTLKPSSQGFNFLGFTVKKIRRKNGKFKTLIYPSKGNVLRHGENMRRIIQANKSSSAYGLIQELRPRIIGWCNYYRYCECSKTFDRLSYVTYQKLRAWMWRRSTQGRRKIKEKYMPSGKTYLYEDKPHQNNWTLYGETKGKQGVKLTNFLPTHAWVGSKKFVKVQGDKSPYDGDTMYWITRTANYTYHSSRLSKLIRRQHGFCTLCKTRFLHTDETLSEVDHKTPRSLRSSDHYTNLQAVHKDCHRKKTNREAKERARLRNVNRCAWVAQS